MKRLYVAGPMTGLPEYNLPAFVAATEQLIAAGFDAVNPGRRGADPAKTWQDYMRLGLADLLSCEGVALLPGWHRSRGARLECTVALQLDMTVDMVEDWLQ